MLDLYQLSYLQQLSLKEKETKTQEPTPTPMPQMSQMSFISSFQNNYNALFDECENLKKKKSDLLRDYNFKLAQNAALNNISSFEIQSLIDEINKTNSRIRELERQLAQY